MSELAHAQRPAGYTGDMLLKLPGVVAVAGICKTEVYRLESLGLFPKRIHLGRSARWSATEVASWVQARIAERDA